MMADLNTQNLGVLSCLGCGVAAKTSCKQNIYFWFREHVKIVCVVTREMPEDGSIQFLLQPELVHPLLKL